MVGEQLWYTASSAISSLQDSWLDYEIIVVMNGEYPMAASMLHTGLGTKAIFAGASVNSPQAARHAGFVQSRGDPVFFLDSHVVVPPKFFSQIVADMDETGADFVGTGHRYLGQTWYGCRVAWDEYLWHNRTYSTPMCERPYRVAVHPHGGFAVRRSSYLKAGGYWSALNGFGGEETQLCFKFWMCGLSCWMTPRTYHWHWLAPGSRRGPELWRDERFARNFHMVAATYGGGEYLRRAHKSFKILHWNNVDLYPSMVEEVESDPKICVEKKELSRFQTLSDLRKFFDAEGIIN